MNDKKQSRDIAIEHLKAGMAMRGVASVKVSDGELFGFTRETILSFLAAMDQKKEDHVIVFIQTSVIPDKFS